MRDIVKRLRDAAEHDVGFGPLLREAAEAADDIERLRKEVANLRELVQAKNEYIACYKTGRCPSERLFAKLDRLTRLIGEPPAIEGGE